MTPKQQRFAEEFAHGLHAGNGTRSAIEAGFSAKTANRKAYQLLRMPEVVTEIERLRADQSRRLNITSDMILRRRWAIATADANELIEHRRVNCRYCWGKGHQYQWTRVEFEEAQAGGDPQILGGLGFVKNRDPHPSCPECQGEGVESVHVHDSRRLTGAARLLYRGIKKSKDGIEVLMADQDKALDAVERQLGFDKAKTDGEGPEIEIIGGLPDDE